MASGSRPEIGALWRALAEQYRFLDEFERRAEIMRSSALVSYRTPPVGGPFLKEG
jgi:hypothetical protein